MCYVPCAESVGTCELIWLFKANPILCVCKVKVYS
uniref:Uncharacterized protein n=1 Tax=Anguilla anguilla TaxID=7936 RepID=A0A0E9QFE1_ANGAN